jgi:acyl carrier protein
MAHDYDKRIYATFCSVFHVTPDTLTDQTRRGELEEWDSLGHAELLEALSEEFNVTFSVETALAMETLHDIKQIIASLIK